MTHIFSTGVNQMRHITHLSQKYDTSERSETMTPITGFLAVRLTVADPSPPTSLYDFPVNNSPSTPRMFSIRSSTA